MKDSFQLSAVAEAVYSPHGIAEIVTEFGEINHYIGQDGQLDPRWNVDFMAQVPLPFPLVLAWDHSKTVSRFTCHKKMVEVFAEVFSRIHEEGLQTKLWSFGGCFSFRPQRTGHKLSTHCWGIAIDLNLETNGLGTIGDMDPDVVQVFREAGFTWGGGWLGRARDPMHFQYCSGY